jgi:hypothetical protein
MTDFPAHTTLIKCDFCRTDNVANNTFNFRGWKACRGCFHRHTHNRDGMPIDWVSLPDFGKRINED